MSPSTEELPEVQFGDRFKIQSRRGSEYTVTCLGHGDEGGFFFVRLEDGRIARLDRARLDWETFVDLPDAAAPLRTEDPVLVECSSGTLRGALEQSPGPDGLELKLPIGGEVQLPWVEIDDLYLLFRARDLKRGDWVAVKSRTGNDYHGQLLAVVPGDCLRLRLREGGDVDLKIGKLDLKSIFVTIALPLGLLRGERAESS